MSEKRRDEEHTCLTNEGSPVCPACRRGAAVADPTVDSGARFKHDHECTYLGPCWGGEREYADLYWCDQGGWLPTVIARFSSEDSDYTSGMVLAEHDPYLAEAKRRAEDRGLPTTPAPTGPEDCDGCMCSTEHDGDYGSSGHTDPCPPHTCERRFSPAPTGPEEGR